MQAVGTMGGGVCLCVQVKKQKKAMQEKSNMEGAVEAGEWKLSQRVTKSDRHRSGAGQGSDRHSTYRTGLATDEQQTGQKRKKQQSLFGSSEEEDESGSESDSQGAPPEEVGIQLPKKRKTEQGGGRGGRGQGRRGGANRGGRGGRGSGGGGGAGGDKHKPAFNPYDIPDENLIKAGKRSAVMPRSGNRTMTFRK